MVERSPLPLPTWVPDPAACPLHHLPLGVRRRPDGSHALVARIGEAVADLRVLAEIGLFDDCGAERADFRAAGLEVLLARGRGVHARVRRRLQECLGATPTYYDLRDRREIFLLPASQAALVAPVQIGDAALFVPAAGEGLGAGFVTLRSSSFQAGPAELARGYTARVGEGLRELACLPGVAYVVGHGPGARVGGAYVEGAYVAGAMPVLCFGASRPLRVSPPSWSVTGAWMTPAEAVAGEDIRLELSHAPYRRGEETVAMASTRECPASVEEQVERLTAAGARLRPGDLLVSTFPDAALPPQRLAEGDAITLRAHVGGAEGAFSLMPATARLTGTKV